MSRRSSAAKWDEWANRFERYRESQQSVGRFCQAEGISPASFYRWKKLGAGVRCASRPTPLQAPKAPGRAFQPVDICLPVRAPAKPETTIRIGRDIQIELGSDLTVVEAILQQLLTATGVAAVKGAASC